MSLLVPWVLFPAVLVLLCAGCGTVVCRLARLRAGPTVLLPLGYAAIVVVTGFAVWIPGAGELAAPAVVGLAAAGGVLWVAGGPRLHRSWLWPLGAAVAVFLAYGAPILLTGTPTFAGYITLDDASTLFAMTDRALEHGRTVDGLAPSTYEATLSTSLMVGYPLGTLLPFGIGAELTGQDLAWVFQPYLAFLAGLLALGLYGLAGSFVERPVARAAVAAIAAQPALLYAYGLWDGNKELAAAALLALLAPLAVRTATPDDTGRTWLAAAVAAAALVTALSLGVAVWILPAAALTAVLAYRARTWTSPLLAAGTTLVLALPALAGAATFLDRDNVASWRDDERLANLIEPLSPAQVAGIWPAGDFRLRPEELGPTAVLVVLVLVLAGGGIATWARREAWASLALAASSVVGMAVVWAVGSPWVEAKAFATASPAILLAAAAGCAWILARGRAVEAGLAAAAVAAGVLWSNALAYHHASLAPRAQLRELETIGERFAGAGPALMTEYQPYGVRHFLRELDAEGASELRRRVVPLRDGSSLDKGEYADLDDFRLDAILDYPTLVLRRSPVASRPPAPYRLRWQGEWYEVWQRPAGAAAPISAHLPLGGPLSPSAVAACGDVLRLATTAATVAAVPRDGAFVAALPSSGVVTARTARRGRYSLWLGGSVRGRVDAYVDGRRIGRVRHHLNNEGQWLELGRVVLRPGTHRVRLRFEPDAFRPGSGGRAWTVGPVALVPTRPARSVRTSPAIDAPRLCGRALDWLEARG